MQADTALPAQSPLVLVIHQTPPRALLAYASQPGMLDLASGHHPILSIFAAMGLRIWGYRIGADDPDFGDLARGPQQGKGLSRCRP